MTNREYKKTHHIPDKRFERKLRKNSRMTINILKQKHYGKFKCPVKPSKRKS